MKSLIILSFSLFSVFTFSNEGEISSKLITPAEVSNLRGTYLNKAGFELTIGIEQPNGQLDLFEPFEYLMEIEVDEKNSGVHFAFGTPSIDVSSNGIISIEVLDNDCQDQGCMNIETYYTLTKKRNGTYSIMAEVSIEKNLEYDDFVDYPAYANLDDEELDRAIETDGATQKFCNWFMGQIPYMTNIYADSSTCSGSAKYYLEKK